jgi:ABC-type antimicrobial peptide transport system permease subunit
VAEGRRESAVFRAIGARRVDVGSIYGTYALLLSLRVVLFAVVLGAVMALVVEVLYQADATMGARLAYAAIDVTKEFHLFSIWSWYIPVIMVAIVAVGLLASVIPILLGARRNPIRDMRNE